MVNLVDVARRADVSPITVSRVLNNDLRVLPRTRRLVLQAIEELGYVPNEAARALRRSSSRTIGLVAAELGSAGMMSFLGGFSNVVSGRGYALMLCDSHASLETEAENLRLLIERRVDGVAVLAVGNVFGNLRLFEKAGIPHLPIFISKPIDSEWEPLFDVQEEMGLLLGYLTKLGHRRISLIYRNDPLLAASAPHVLDGLSKMGLDSDPALLVTCGSPEECEAATSELLRTPERPTAIISGSAIYTPYVLHAVQDARLSIPVDLSVLTAGDSPWHGLYSPPLTSIAPDFVRMGMLSAQYLFGQIGGQSSENMLPTLRDAFRYKLVVRNSCAPPSKSQ